MCKNQRVDGMDSIPVDDIIVILSRQLECLERSEEDFMDELQQLVEPRVGGKALSEKIISLFICLARAEELQQLLEKLLPLDASGKLHTLLETSRPNPLEELTSKNFHPPPPQAKSASHYNLKKPTPVRGTRLLNKCMRTS